MLIHVIYFLNICQYQIKPFLLKDFESTNSVVEVWIEFI